jgi:hypothetical protein
MEILKKILPRFFFAIFLFLIANLLYTELGYEKDTRKYSRVKYQIDSAFLKGDIIYMGESSNTSFNPWTDTLSQSISDFLQLYMPNKKIEAITHESFHPGLFLKMLNLLPNDNRNRTLIMTVNLRTCGPSAVFSSNEASNQQEALFYSQRPALLTRIFLSLHFYDNRPAPERERMKVNSWRTVRIDQPGFQNRYSTVRDWYDHNPLASNGSPTKLKDMGDAYIKEFAFILDENNPRVKDLDAIVEICKQKKIKLIFHLLPENRDYAERLFGSDLVKYIDYNAKYLVDHFTNKGVTIINNYPGPTGVNYTDQWYPTEHMNGTMRRDIARTIANKLNANIENEFVLKANNYPNPKVKQPLADTLLSKFGWHP